MRKMILKQECKKRILSVVLAVCAAWGWWGAIYPQFTLLRGTYSVVYEQTAEEADGTEVAGTETARTEADGMETDGRELYWQILNADRSRIKFRSRLITDWNALQKAEE